MHVTDRVERERWDRFAWDHGTFLHSTGWLQYTLAATGEEDSAFAAFNDDHLLAIVPAARAAMSRPDGSFGGGPVVAPAVASNVDPRVRMKVLDLCLAELERQGRALIQLSPLVPRFPERFVEMAAATTCRGWQDQSLTTTVLDLSRETLWEDLRKDHRSTLRNLVDVETSVRTDAFALNAFAKMHRDFSAQERPFSLMRTWDNFVVVFASLAGQVEGATLLLTHGSVATEVARVSAPQRALGHVMVWRAAHWLKALGVRFYELGVQNRGLLPYDRPSEKQKAISAFKRGFGGLELPLLIRGKQG